MIKLFGIKLIMNQFFTLTGKTYANTLIKIGPCFIINKKFKEIDGYNAIQLGYNYCKYHVLNKSKLGYLQHQNIIPLTFLKEFLIENPNKFRIGQILASAFLVKFSYVNYYLLAVDILREFELLEWNGVIVGFEALGPPGGPRGPGGPWWLLLLMLLVLLGIIIVEKYKNTIIKYINVKFRKIFKQFLN
jgi:hypothetical protein